MSKEKKEAPADNSPFSEEELEHFRTLLKSAQEEAREKTEQFKSRLKELEDALDDTSSSAAHHQGNIASSEEEREKYYTLIEKEKDKLGEIKVALDRIEAGKYGVCLVTGKAIQKERLEAMPWARLSVDAKKSEKGNRSKDRMQVNEAV